MAHPGGRPSEYKPEYVDLVIAYLATQQDIPNDYSGTKKVNLPTRESFAKYIDVSLKSLLNWEAEHPEFLRALEKIDHEQKQRVLEKSLVGDYNSTIAKLILSSNHGMRERTETDLTTKGEKIEFMDAKAFALAKKYEDELLKTL